MDIIVSILTSEFSISVLSGALASLIVLIVAYFLFEGKFQKYLNDQFDKLKEPSRKKLFYTLYDETIRIGFSCQQLIHCEDSGDRYKVPVLNDRINVLLGSAYMSSMHFGDQLSLYSGTLDYTKIDRLSEISSAVSKIRTGLNSLRQFDSEFYDNLGFYAPEDPDPIYSDKTRFKKISAEEFDIRPVKFPFSDKDYKVIYNLNYLGVDRDLVWCKFFTVYIHNLLLDAYILCNYVIKYAHDYGYSLEEAEKELSSHLDSLRGNDSEESEDRIVRITSIIELKERIHKSRMAILENGFYLVNHVVPPIKVTPEP